MKQPFIEPHCSGTHLPEAGYVQRLKKEEERGGGKIKTQRADVDQKLKSCGFMGSKIGECKISIFNLNNIAHFNKCMCHCDLHNNMFFSSDQSASFCLCCVGLQKPHECMEGF